MNTNQVLILARKNLGGVMESSARLCLADAVQLFDADDHEAAKAQALRSLKFSVGILHADFIRASR